MNIFPQLSYHLTLCKPFIYGYKSFTIEQKCIRAHNFQNKNKVTIVTACNPSWTSCSEETSTNKKNILLKTLLNNLAFKKDKYNDCAFRTDYIVHLELLTLLLGLALLNGSSLQLSHISQSKLNVRATPSCSFQCNTWPTADRASHTVKGAWIKATCLTMLVWRTTLTSIIAIAGTSRGNARPVLIMTSPPL